MAGLVFVQTGGMAALAMAAARHRDRDLILRTRDKGRSFPIKSNQLCKECR